MARAKKKDDGQRPGEVTPFLRDPDGTFHADILVVFGSPEEATKRAKDRMMMVQSAAGMRLTVTLDDALELGAEAVELGIEGAAGRLKHLKEAAKFFAKLIREEERAKG